MRGLRNGRLFSGLTDFITANQETTLLMHASSASVGLALKDAAVIVGPAGQVTAADFAGLPQAA
jgi:hypothetical protein